jgi:hypothetical protein
VHLFVNAMPGALYLAVHAPLEDAVLEYNSLISQTFGRSPDRIQISYMREQVLLPSCRQHRLTRQGGDTMSSSIIRAAVAGLITLAVISPALAFDPPFPRLGGIEISSPFNYNTSAYEAAMARQSISIITDYPGFASTVESAATAIHGLNQNSLVFAYVSDNYMDTGGKATWTGFKSKIDSMKWYLYSSGQIGSPVVTSDTNQWPVINNTPYTPKDSSGYDSVQWMTHFFVDNLTTSATPIDGFYMDNMFSTPRDIGDWNLDGTADPILPSGGDPNNSAAAGFLRAGAVEYVSTARSLMSGKYQIANIEDWSRSPVANGAVSANVPTAYQNLIDGGVMEAFIASSAAIANGGKGYSFEHMRGWSDMMTGYHRTMASLLEPKLGIFNVAAASNDYQTLRYGLTSCLMDDGYFSFTDYTAGYTGVVWFDEYNVNLGAALGIPSAFAWQSGVYRRDYENGIALVNPNGNSATTVTLESNYVKINGTQDHTTNNGTTVNTVTLQPSDGIILLRPASTTNTFGRTTIASATSAGMTADMKRGTSFTLAQAGTLTSFSAYLDGNGGTTGYESVRMVLYQDASGIPGTKVVESKVVTIASGMGPQWVKFTAPETQLAAGTYWIVLHAGGTGGIARNYGDGTGAWYGNSDTFSDGASSPFGSGTSGSDTLSVYASFVPGTLKQLGRTTIASSTSSGMTADYKRGSSFTLSETGMVTSLSAYLDGNGGASGTQDVRMALYRDSSGAPGNIVQESATVTITSGMPAQWVKFVIPQVALTAGTYWIVIQTGNVQGIARNYGDGTTPWYGNADVYWDGTNSPFGSGTTGSTALSVYASYVH